MRGDKSFAYDLVVQHGPVNSRVALLLRSIEGKPLIASICYPIISLSKASERGSQMRNVTRI